MWWECASLHTVILVILIFLIFFVLVLFYSMSVSVTAEVSSTLVYSCALCCWEAWAKRAVVFPVFPVVPESRAKACKKHEATDSSVNLGDFVPISRV